MPDLCSFHYLRSNLSKVFKMHKYLVSWRFLKHFLSQHGYLNMYSRLYSLHQSLFENFYSCSYKSVLYCAGTLRSDKCMNEQRVGSNHNLQIRFFTTFFLTEF